MSTKDTKKSNKFRLKPISVIALVLCAVIAVYCGTTAWLTGTVLSPVRYASLEDFTYNTSVSFSSAAIIEDDVPTASGIGYIDSVTKSIIVSTNPADTNYVGNLRFSIRQVGSGVAFVRVKITHEWYNTTQHYRVQDNLNLPFEITEDDFADKREADGYIYSKGAFKPGRAYAVVSGFDAADFDTSGSADYQLRINITVDAVQFNRYQQLWGMSKRPWLADSQDDAS